MDIEWMIIWPAGTPDIHENIAWSSLYLCVDVVGQSEIQVKMKFIYKSLN